MIVTLADEAEDIYLNIPDLHPMPEAIIFAGRAWVRPPGAKVFIGKRTYVVEEGDDE